MFVSSDALAQIVHLRIGKIHIPVVHPDDASAVAFVTEQTFDKVGIQYILQDGEPKEVYTDRAQRSFNTAEPLQISATDDGRLHVRFYSPRELKGVLIRARIASAAPSSSPREAPSGIAGTMKPMPGPFRLDCLATPMVRGRADINWPRLMSEVV